MWRPALYRFYPSNALAVRRLAGRSPLRGAIPAALTNPLIPQHERTGNDFCRCAPMIEAAVTWHASRAGLTIYRGGEVVAVIEFRLFAQLVLDLVRIMR